MREQLTRIPSRRRTAQRSAALAAAAVLVLSEAPLAAPTLLTFEDLAPGTTVTNQYAARGVLFKAAFVAVDPAARSGTRALRPISPSAEVFAAIPFVISFRGPQARVKMFANSPGAARVGTLQAFDATGAVVSQDGPKQVAADAFTTMFEVTLNRARIRRVVLQLEGVAHYAIDDLEFDASATTAAPPLVRTMETSQRSVRDNAAVTGKFRPEWDLGTPPELRGRERSEPAGEPEERFGVDFAPTVERELAPGASGELSARVAARTGLAGSARWIGTDAPLPVTLSMNGVRIGSGKTYALGTDRGGADVGAVAETAGDVRLSVTNTSSVRVRVRLNLGIVRP